MPEFLPPSIAHQPEDKDQDYESIWKVTHMFCENIYRAFKLSDDVFDVREDRVMEDVNLEQDDKDSGDEIEGEEKENLGKEAEVELDDICDNDDKKIALELDPGFSAL
ncbi:uncharacterized protein BT62DRAFT_920472 [Guyanagaster necrorhizus]|uniref:Uncharacterized protein n=1 Tax=Guyanagaster necrorhizus TaxID=856835 RepID=A0A9P7VRC2_9AGAR|nr:uncharacterized protein BT62DRAFT_920472 [Guyanagaster necrorhizus MCA 3950]KAG7445182.1 hypothetical protein BT62DRAFT_920472 [Guyanagaster necrorhizus MCA 3950]